MKNFIESVCDAVTEVAKSFAVAAASAALSLCILCALCISQSAEAQSFYGTTTINFGTNTFIGSSAPGGTTNYPPFQYIAGTNANATNYGAYITNTFSGWVDNTKEGSFCVQSGIAIGVKGGTNTGNVVFMWEPSLDGVNPDSTANTAFWVTNNLTKSPTTAGFTNVSVVTTNFPGGASYGVGWFYLAGIINNNTNAIYGALTNASGTNVATDLSTNNFFLQVGAKKSLVIGP